MGQTRRDNLQSGIYEGIKVTDYRTYEDSVASGKPIELYHIYDSDGNHYRYNTSRGTVTYLGADYEPEIINRSNVVLGGFGGEGYPLKVTFTRGNLLAVRFIHQPIDAVVTLILYRQHEGYYIRHWTGYLIHMAYDEDGMPIGTFESVLDTTTRMGHRRRCSKICDLVLYKYGCMVNQEIYKVTGTITNISSDGLILTGSQFGTKPDDWFVGGKVRVSNAYRLIKAHSGLTVTIDRKFYEATSPCAFTAYAGCAHTPAACAAFGNKINFGGNEFLPTQNPFEVNIEF